MLTLTFTVKPFKAKILSVIAVDGWRYAKEINGSSEARVRAFVGWKTGMNGLVTFDANKKGFNFEPAA